MNPAMIRVRHLRPFAAALLAALLGAACSSTPSPPPSGAESKPRPAAPSQHTGKPPATTPLDPVVREVAGDIHSQRIMYNDDPRKLEDCSGMFLRAAGGIVDQCPNLLAPTPDEARSSDAIAQWYRDKGLYQPVSNALLQDHLIRPGAVLFYKRRNEGAVSHMGLVTDVKLNGRGEVERYWLFHGRNWGKAAEITGYHYRRPSKDVPLGVGDKELVGAAQLCPQGECRCASTSAQRPGDAVTAADAAARPPAAKAPLTLASADSLIGTGIASYYHRSLHGRPTASGEIYDHGGMSAAHRRLRFGTRVRVTRLDTGRSVVVRVNDRGPFVDGRIIDLSGAAARQLDMMGVGVTEVRVERVQ